MRYAQNDNVYESTAQYATITETDISCRKHTELSDKVLLEPYVRLTDTYGSTEGEDEQSSNPI